jgi:hypothetical protein
MDTPYDYSIYDIRLINEFKGMTISGYKKIEVINVFYNSLFNSELENACRWGVELHSSGLIKNIFDKIELLYFKNINISNPYFIFYYYQRKEILDKLLNKYPKNIILFSRNCQEIRNLICELICIICLSKKNIIFENKSLPKIKDYNNINKLKLKIISKDTHKLYNYLNDNDPSEVKLALNEIINILYSSDYNFDKVIFWYLWLRQITITKLKGKNKTDFNFKCSVYNIENIGDNYKTDWVWPLWKIILDFIESSSNIISNFIKKIYIEFKKEYDGYFNKPKHYQIMFSFYILTTSINWKINIRQHNDQIIQACSNINYLYKNIEDYLHKNDSDKKKIRQQYIKDIFKKSILEENKRKTNMITLKDNATGKIIEHKITQDDKNIIKYLHNKKKNDAFINFIPKINMNNQTDVSNNPIINNDNNILKNVSFNNYKNDNNNHNNNDNNNDNHDNHNNHDNHDNNDNNDNNDNDFLTKKISL